MGPEKGPLDCALVACDISGGPLTMVILSLQWVAVLCNRDSLGTAAAIERGSCACCSLS